MSSLFILLAAVIAGPEPSEVLRDIPSARHYLAETFDHHVRFDLVGIVECVDQLKYWFILSDTTNRVCLQSRVVTPKVRPGTRIRVRGISERENAYEHRLECKDAETLGPAPLPRVRDLSIAEILNPANDKTTIRASGTVTDVCIDEYDPRYRLLTLSAAGKSALIALKDPNQPLSALNVYLGAEISVTGLCSLGAGIRPYMPAAISIDSTNAISILRAPPKDPFDQPTLSHDRRDLYNNGSNGQRRRVDGTVLASWRGNRIILDDGHHHAVMAELATGEILPSPGTHITLVGFPTTDFFHVNLMSALCRTNSHSRSMTLSADPIPMTTVRAAARDMRFIHPGSHGQLIRLQGVVDFVSPAADPNARMRLNCDGLIIDVYASSCPTALSDIVQGCLVETDGICVLEAQAWSPERRFFPHIENCAVVVRTPSDIRIISRPPWWTPGLLLGIIALLVILVIAALCWGGWLNRLVERRSRELLHEQVAHRLAESRREDRTRLAVELHDSLSQTLAAVAFQISSARSGNSGHSSVETRLSTAERMLDSCRAELRHCLMDLRSNALEERNFETAVRTSVDAVRCETAVETSVNIPRSGLNDSVAHALLMIVRELVSNAVRHGHAKSIRILGTTDKGVISLSVADDGCGFDADARPGFREGHFGIDGIRQRLKALNGTLSIVSAPGRGTTVSLKFNPKKGCRT